MAPTTSIEIREPTHLGISIELSGELDIRDLEHLRCSLDDALTSELATCVHLLEVSFLDMRCTRELAIRARLHGSQLELRNPSWQVETSFRACGFENLVFCSFPEGEHPYASNTRKRTERDSRSTLALAG
jgi:anti-anti-sigma regulatory factor